MTRRHTTRFMIEFGDRDPDDPKRIEAVAPPEAIRRQLD